MTALLLMAALAQPAVGDRVQSVTDPAIVGEIVAVSPSFISVRLDEPVLKKKEGEGSLADDLRKRILDAEAELRHYEQRSRAPHLEVGWKRARDELAALRPQLERLATVEAIRVVRVPVGSVRLLKVGWFV